MHMKSANSIAKFSLLVYCQHHAQTFFDSLGRMYRAPLASGMTIAVIAIALALPTGFNILLHNLQQLVQTIELDHQISLFLNPDLSDKEINSLAKEILQRPDVATLQVKTSEQALNEFAELSDLGDALENIANPLPAVLLITPDLSKADWFAVEKLLAQLQHLPQVEFAQLDLQWVQRLQAILQLIERGLWVIVSLLALSVVLVIGNTIRLDIENRRAEIEVYKLIGATTGFIRRPFLYTGLWYGCLGGLTACLIVILALWLLATPAAELVQLYGSTIQLSGMQFKLMLIVTGLAMLLGYLGAWLAVGRHLRQIEPQ